MDSLPQYAILRLGRNTFHCREDERQVQTHGQPDCYLPPEMKDGILKSGLMVSEEDVVVIDLAGKGEQEHSIKEMKEQVVEKSVEQRESEEQSVLVLDEKPSEDVAVDGESGGGSAEQGDNVEMSNEGVTQNIPRTQLAQATLEDLSLETFRILAENVKEGYHFSDGILFHTRLDQFGQPREQICLPTKYRQKCLTLAHNHLGHHGRNKL